MGSIIYISLERTTRKGPFDMALKLKVVEAAGGTNNRAATRKLSVDEANVCYRRKQKHALQTTTTILLDTGTEVYNLPRHRRGYSIKALKLHQGNDEFTASQGWLEKLLKRHEFTLKRRRTVDQKLPQDHVLKTISYLMRLRKCAT